MVWQLKIIVLINEFTQFQIVDIFKYSFLYLVKFLCMCIQFSKKISDLKNEQYSLKKKLIFELTISVY